MTAQRSADPFSVLKTPTESVAPTHALSVGGSGLQRSAFVTGGMRSLTAGAAPAQQPRGPGTGEGGSVGMPPLAFSPPETSRRQYQLHRRRAQRARAGHPGGRICPCLAYQTDSTTDAAPWPPVLPLNGRWLWPIPWWPRGTDLCPDAVRQIHRIPLPPFHPGP